MQLFWWRDNGVRFWPAPALLGVVFILIGVLLYHNPALLSYFVAGICVLVGIGLLISAWHVRRQVTYQKLDRPWDGNDPPGESRGS